MALLNKMFRELRTRNLRGRWRAKGRMHAPIMICAVGLTALVSALWFVGPAADTVCVEAKLLPSDGARGDGFARDYMLDVSGDVIVAGADKNDDVGSNSGSAYIFRFNGSKWIEEAKLLPSDGSAGDTFGRAVAICDDVVVVGADHDRGSKGSAYVFRFNGTDWVEEAKLVPTDVQKGARFGKVVGLHSDVIVVGAFKDNDLGKESGSAYIFRHNGRGWIEEAKLLASDGMVGDRFGRSASIHGNLAIFGAARDTVDGKLSGSIYVFRYDGTKWNQEATLAPSDGADLDWFGRYVDVHGDLIIGGANKHSHLDYFESGAAYIFRYDGEKWVEEAELLASDMAHKDWFGRSVTIHQDMAVVGSHRTYNNGMHSGSAYIFRYDGTRWAEELKLLPSDGDPWDFFGRACSLTGDWLVVGANQDDDQGKDSGSAYVFPASVGRESCTARDCGCKGDVNGDSIIDALDSGLVLTKVGCPVGDGDPDCDAADPNNDGRVDSLDVDFILARFDQKCDAVPATSTLICSCKSRTQ